MTGTKDTPAMPTFVGPNLLPCSPALANPKGDGGPAAGRLRVLALTNLYPRPGRETLALYNRRQLHALSARHDVRVVAPVPWTEEVPGLLRLRPTPRAYVNADGLHVYHPRFYYPPRVRRHTYGGFFLWSVRKTVRRVAAEFRPDVLLASWAHPDGWAAVELGRELGIPVVLKVVGSDVLVLGKDKKRRDRIAEALRGADRVVAVSRHLAQHVLKFGMNPDKVHVVCEGTDQKLFSPGDQAAARKRLGLPEQGKILLYVGNLLRSKGAGMVVETCRRLHRRVEGLRVYLVGRGPDAKPLQWLIDGHDLGDVVRLPGPAAQEALVDWYRASDVVLLPSFSEGIPNVLREAMACGRPFVASRVGGIPEIADPAFGRLVPPGDAAKLADAVEEFLDYPPHVDPVRVAEINISWEASAAQLGRHLMEVCAGRSGPTADVPRATD